MIRWIRYRRRGLSAKHPRWAALDERLAARDTTQSRQAPEVVVNAVSPWWTHPVDGAERLARDSERTELRREVLTTTNHPETGAFTNMERYDRDVGCMGIPPEPDPRPMRTGTKIAIAVAAGLTLAVLGAIQADGMRADTSCEASPLTARTEQCA